MLEVQKQQIKSQSKIAVIGDTLDARLDHLANLAQKLDKDGTEHYLTAMDRFRQCGEVLLTAQAEIEGEKAKWRELNWKQKEKPENEYLKPCTTFVQYIAQKVNIEKREAYYYMAIAEGWEEYALHECKTLTEALERIGKISNALPIFGRYGFKVSFETPICEQLFTDNPESCHQLVTTNPDISL